jgi:hypothetical protein
MNRASTPPDIQNRADPALSALQAEAGRHDEERIATLAFRIEAAALLDRAMRLESKLGTVREGRSRSILQRLRRTVLGMRHTGQHHQMSGADSHERTLKRCAAVILKSGLFDSEYYLRRNPDVAAAGAEPVVHYVERGAGELRSPGPFFSTRWYTDQYPDVSKSGKNPLYHYIIHGHAEGRRPLPSDEAFSDTDVERPPGSGGPAFGPIVAIRDHAGDLDAPGHGMRASGSRLVIYTALFGDYDELFQPSPEQAASCDFVIFTDQPSIPVPWRRAQVDFASPDNSKRNRFHKLLPHRLFPQYEWSLYLDANIDLRANPIEFLDRYCRLGPAFFVFPHPVRTSIAEELGACIQGRRDDAVLMLRQVARYLDSGFGHAFPLTENNVLLRRHNDPDLVALSEAWWEEVRSKSGRDQLSLPYVVERSGYKDIALFGNDISARTSADFAMRSHRTRSYYADMLSGRAV